MKTAVEVLGKYFKGRTITEREIFLTFLESFADTQSKYYCMDKLHMLAEVINELEAYYLVDEIAKYDYKASMVLDELLKE
jgi:hypothetical protein